MDNTYCLKKGTSLFRYDLIEPPTEWSSTHRNIEYTGSIYGDKNSMSAFFFFNSECQAVGTARCATKKYADKRDGSIWITRCNLKDDMKLLDLRSFASVIDMLVFLVTERYNILSTQYKSFFNDAATLDNIKDSTLFLVCKIHGNNTYYNDSSFMNEIIPHVNVVIEFLKINIFVPGQFVQLLTDYSNGPLFKSEVISKGYEGIIFNETSNRNTGSDTVCLFSTQKLEIPIQKKYDYERTRTATISSSHLP